MKRLILSAGFIALMTTDIQAANLAVITSPPTLLNILVLLFAGACLFICFQVLTLVKGGQLSRSWQMFLIAFSLLVISQLANLLNTFEILNIPNFVVPVLMMLTVGLFLYGIYETKRVLS